MIDRAAWCAVTSDSLTVVSIPVRFDPSPENDVAVTLPVILILPVPVTVLLFRSKLPPSCGVVSLTTSAETITVAIPADPEVAETVTPLDPLKSIVDMLPPVPTTDPL